MEEIIDLRQLFGTLKKHLWLIALITIIAAMISGIISFFVLTPVYQARTQILVNQESSEQQPLNAYTIQTNIQLISTYNEIITSPVILEDVVKKLNLNVTAKQLSGQVQVTNSQDSQVAHIVVQDTDAKRATDIANTTAAVFQEKIPSIMSIDNVSVLSKAELADSLNPIKPAPLMNIAIAIVVGLMLGVGLAFLLEYLDQNIKNEQDVERILQIPVIGVISEISDGEVQPSPTSQSYTHTKGVTRGV